MNKFTVFKNSILDTIFPDDIKCIFCDEELKSKDINCTCTECLNSLPYITHACARCGASIPDDNTGVCENCKKHNFKFEKVLSIFTYTDPITQLIHKVKFSNKPYPIPDMAKYMATMYESSNLHIDYATFVPISSTRKKRRSFDQAEALCKEFCKLTRLPMLKLCDKVKDNQPQAQLSFNERTENVKDCYKFITKEKDIIKNKRILIIDDVYTTGATMNAVATEIMSNKAKCCFGITFAHSKLDD